MRVERHDDVAAYERLVLPLLMADEARFNMEIAILARLRAGVTFGPLPPLLLSVHDGDEIFGAALMTRPYQAIVAPVPVGATPAVADWFADEAVELPGALGSPDGVTAFATRYAERTGTTFRTGREEGVFRLTTLVPPRPTTGALRQAGEADVPLVLDWVLAFQEEVGLPHVDREMTAQRTRDGMVWLWEDGAPVSLAGCGGFTPNGARIGPVYTPPELRGRGYASAVTAGVTGELLGRGLRYTFLYTDLANPTSNKIYRDIGYEHVADVREVTFRG
jgi:ribosomal protein S18 acetylase RimI-like enzyme